MSAPLISAVQSKGGSCKTSTAIILALAALENGERVLFLDGDKNKDSSSYLSALEIDNLIIQELKEGEVLNTVTQYENDVDIMIADTQGGRTGLSTTMLGMSDLSIIPVMRSHNDVKNGVFTITDIVQLARKTPSLLTSFRVLWSNTPQRGASLLERKHMQEIEKLGAPQFKAVMMNRPVLELFTTEKINPYRFIENPDAYREQLIMEGETLSESALNNRVLDYTRKAEGLIGDMGQVYAEVLTTVTEIMAEAS